MGLYRVNHGIHLVQVRDSNNIPVDITYPRGSIVESDVDLCERFNVRDFTPKFERVDGPSHPGQQYYQPPEPDIFDTMTEAELVSFCEQEEVDITGAKGTGNILRIIRDTIRKRDERQVSQESIRSLQQPDARQQPQQPTTPPKPILPPGVTQEQLKPSNQNPQKVVAPLTPKPQVGAAIQAKG